MHEVVVLRMWYHYFYQRGVQIPLKAGHYPGGVVVGREGLFMGGARRWHPVYCSLCGAMRVTTRVTVRMRVTSVTVCVTRVTVRIRITCVKVRVTRLTVREIVR